MLWYNERLRTNFIPACGTTSARKSNLQIKCYTVSSRRILKYKRLNEFQHPGGEKTTAGWKIINQKFKKKKKHNWNLFQSSSTGRFAIDWGGGKKDPANMKVLDAHVLHCWSNGKGRLRMGGWRRPSDCGQRHIARSCKMSTSSTACATVGEQQIRISTAQPAPPHPQVFSSPFCVSLFSDKTCHDI